MVKIHYRTLQAMTIPFTLALATEEEQAADSLLDQISPQIQAELDRIEADYSAFRADSLLSRFQAGEKNLLLTHPEFQAIYSSCLAYADLTEGYFDPYYKGAGIFDPTGYVKGWAIQTIFERYLADLIYQPGVIAVALNGGGDMQVKSRWDCDFTWQIGLENPHNLQEVIAKFNLKEGGLATSGLSKRGQHVQQVNPDRLDQVTIIAPKLSQADVWATAGLAAGKAAFDQLIAREKLSGAYYYQNQVIFFTNGDFTHV